MAYVYNENQYPQQPQQQGSQIGGDYQQQYYPSMFPQQPAAFNPGQYQNFQPGYGPEMGQFPQYQEQQQQQNQSSALPNKMPNQVPKPQAGMKQSPKTNSKASRNEHLVVFPDFVTRGAPATWEFRRKKRMAAINSIYENDKKRIYVTPKAYKRRKMNIKEASTGTKICKVSMKLSAHKMMEVKDLYGNLLFVTRCKKLVQFKKRFEVFLAKGSTDYKNREPDLLVEGGVRKAKKFHVKTPHGKILASLQKLKKKGMSERLKGKVSYEMHIQPDTDCLLMAILLLIQDELFEKTTQTSTGGGFSGADGGGCGGGGCDGGGGC